MNMVTIMSLIKKFDPIIVYMRHILIIILPKSHYNHIMSVHVNSNKSEILCCLKKKQYHLIHTINRIKLLLNMSVSNYYQESNL